MMKIAKEYWALLLQSFGDFWTKISQHLNTFSVYVKPLSQLRIFFFCFPLRSGKADGERREKSSKIVGSERESVIDENMCVVRLNMKNKKKNNKIYGI